VLNLVFDEVHRLHSDPSGRHPEHPRRVDDAFNVLKASEAWNHIRVHGTFEGDFEKLKLIHSKHYISLIEEECGRGFHYIDSDTYVTGKTFQVASRFISTSYYASIKSLESGEPWLIMPRPPGHHAGRDGWAMGAPTLGFCIFNNSAASAQAMLDSGLRVFVLDFDAHHGNGTQDVFWREPKVLHVDLHQEGIYPGTGSVWDVGGIGAEGSKINIPLPAFTGDPEYLWLLDNVVKPLIEVFKPEGVVVSAGFDSHAGDPLTMLEATEITYSTIASMIMGLMHSGMVKSFVTVLEGGYGEGLNMGLKAYVESIIGIKVLKPEVKLKPPRGRVVEDLNRVLRDYWGLSIL